MKRRTPAQLLLHPDSSTVVLDDFFTDREADARPGVLVASVQALKNHENPLSIVRINADAVVAHGKSQWSSPCLHDTWTTGG